MTNDMTALIDGTDVNMPSVPTDPQTSAVTGQNPEYDKLFDYNQAIVYLRQIVNEWESEKSETVRRRLVRDVEVNTEALRQKGQLDEDETIIPVRVIDVNIRREQPPYINYLKNSRRLAIFNCLSIPGLDTQELETEFTRGMTYQGWENVHYKCLDGAETHGWDSIEVVFNPLYPLNVGLEHIGHDKLLFPRSAVDLQASPVVIRIYDVTKLQLQSYVNEFGFDKEQVDNFFSSRKDTWKENETIQIYKKYCKYSGVVYAAWFTVEGNVTNWLKKPEPAFVGIKEKQMQPVQTGIDPLTGIPQFGEQEVWVNKPLTQYPIFLLPYSESEKPRLMDRKGRVFLDEPKQEAQTAILSGFVNGLTRAANLYGSPKGEDGSGSSLKELDNIKLKGGRALSRPFDFWSPPYPDPMVLRALQYFDVANSQETNQLSFAALNRDDSRKTATELDMAQSEQALLNSVQLTLFSTHIRAIYSFCWLIVQSQALQDAIVFLRRPVQQPVINSVTGQPVIDPMTQQVQVTTTMQNDTQRISQIYEVRSAGDVDVIQRSEKLQQMMQDWPVISQTPLAIPFLQDMLRLKYPDKGEAYAGVVQQMDQMQQMKGMLGQLSTILQGVFKQSPEMLSNLPPEQQQAISQLVQQASAAQGQGGQQK